MLFCLNETAPTEIYPLSYTTLFRSEGHPLPHRGRLGLVRGGAALRRGEHHGRRRLRIRLPDGDRKSTRLNSSHLVISYAVFCLKKKRTYTPSHQLTR